MDKLPPYLMISPLGNNYLAKIIKDSPFKQLIHQNLTKNYEIFNFPKAPLQTMLQRKMKPQ